MTMLDPAQAVHPPNVDPVSLQKYRQPLIAGNWKMNGMVAQLSEVEAVATSVQTKQPPVEVLMCLPATLIAQAVLTAAGRIAIGGEDCSGDISGAFTGDLSAEMLKGAGASAVIVGHSERRQHHAETDAIVARKAKAARRAGLLAIICIGETSEQRLAGNAMSVCGDQIAGSVPEGMTASNAVIAYEPLWAIGSGHIPTCEQIIEMHAHIRACLTQSLGAEGKNLRILYGGSVKPASAHSILTLPEVGGVLVGGASQKSADFLAICQASTATSAHSANFPKEQ
ncbi:MULTISPECIES: triose-phosphate isomerase [unclassified Pseudomonas]|uniref:triose-phosphate isomerase n=1 Tax=unclassified Pseudomonas TaxID=196821 RepID=UPI0030DD864A